MKIARVVLLAAIALIASTLSAAAQEVGRPSAALQPVGSELAPSQPADATALVRALLADPAFRGSVSLSENSYDFNAPSGIPGFGPLNPESTDRRLARVAGE